MAKYLEFEDKKFQKKVEKEVLERIEFHEGILKSGDTAKAVVAYIAHNFAQKEVVDKLNEKIDKARKILFDI